MFRDFIVVAGSAIALLSSAPSMASPIVSIQLLETGYAPLTISGTQGTATYVGSYGSYDFNVTAGLGQPLLPSSMGIDLSSNNFTSTGASTLTVLITQTDLTSASPISQYEGSIGGTLSGSVKGLTYSAYADATNAAFGLSQQLGPTTSFATKSFSRDLTGTFTGLSGPFSLTEAVVVTTGSGPGQFSFDAQLSPVPLPTSAPLLGAALLSLGAVGYVAKRKKAATA